MAKEINYEFLRDFLDFADECYTGGSTGSSEAEYRKESTDYYIEQLEDEVKKILAEAGELPEPFEPGYFRNSEALYGDVRWFRTAPDNNGYGLWSRVEVTEL
jgi:hypothetical protein